MRVLFCMLVAASAALPTASAGTCLEIGASPGVGITHEWHALSAGIGADFEWSQQEALDFTEGYFMYVDATVFTMTPTAIFRWFLRGDRGMQPFLTAKASREIPLSVTQGFDTLKDANDDWSSMIGFGLRSFVSDRFSIGGEIGVRASVTRVGSSDWKALRTQFGGLVQYHF